MMLPNKALSFEQALQRWSPPERYGALLELDAPAKHEANSFRIKGSSDVAERRAQERRRLREELEDGLFRLLRRGEILSSADHPRGETNARVLIDPTVYEDRSLAYDPSTRSIVGSDFRLPGIELFNPNRVPDGLKDASFWSPGLNATPSVRGEVEMAERLLAFRHDATYRHVSIRAQEFTLTKLQAEIVRELHLAASADQEWVHLETLRDAVDFGSTKLFHVFRRMPNWGKLIQSDRQGHYRLNI